MRAPQLPIALRPGWTRSVSGLLRDAGRGLIAASHHTLAVVGLAVLALLVFAVGRDEVRHQIEVGALEWLQGRHEPRDAGGTDGAATAEAAAAEEEERAAVSLDALPRQQAQLARWIARRYRVAPEPIAALVHEAWQIGKAARLDPTLILAIAAIESRFNPYAQSAAGAQGLMQVMTRVHDDKFEPFGGTHAAFDPISNLHVGVQVLKESIARAGSLNDGLRYYVGAALLDGDGGYAARVLREQSHMRNVVEGRRVALNASNAPLPAAPRADQPAAALAPPADAPASAAAAGQPALRELALADLG